MRPRDLRTLQPWEHPGRLFVASARVAFQTLPRDIACPGVVLMAGSIAIALNGITVPHFVAALVLLGIGWNFMYTGGTSLLTETHTATEKARVQGANDLAVFVTMGVSYLVGKLVF